MPRFCDSNIESDAIIGKGIDLEELFDQRIVIEKIKIEPTKFPGKNASGMRMQMQVVINAQFNDTADGDGDFFVKDANGIYWYLGYDEPVNASAADGQTGTARGDANRYTITLQDNSKEMPMEVEASIIDGLL